MTLITENNLGATPDDAYEALLSAHASLTPEQAQQFNARLILILMNQVGDLSVIEQAIEKASMNLNSADKPTSR